MTPDTPNAMYFGDGFVEYGREEPSRFDEVPGKGIFQEKLKNVTKRMASAILFYLFC